MSELMLSNATTKRIAAYASRTGITASAAANEAINEWMDTNGDPVINRLDRLAKQTVCRNLVTFPKAKRTAI